MDPITSYTSIISEKPLAINHASALDADQILAARGILEESRLLSWLAQGDYLHYPVYHYATGEALSAQRAKRIAGTGPKYKWVPKKPADPASDWYIIPDAKQAIQRASGVCYVANGEAALLACRAAGLYNVIATTHGESKVPANLRDVLTVFGVVEVRYAADCDETGRKSAVKWREAVEALKIRFVALDLSGVVGAKGDLNDLWIESEFDPALFHHYLDDMPALLLPDREAPVKDSQRQQRQQVSGDYLSQIKHAVESSGRLRGRPDKVNRQLMTCPFHEDHNPSASFYHDSGAIYCFHDERLYRRDEVAERFGVQKPVQIASDKHTYTKRTDINLNDAPVEDLPALDVIAPERVEADRVINAQYLTQVPDLVGRSGLYAIQSDKGTGKTEFAVKLVEALREDVSSVIVVAPLASLASNSAKRYNLEDYDSLNAFQQAQAPFMAITQKSLKNLIGSERINNTDVLILDELSSAIQQLESSKIYTGSESNQSYSVLSKMIATAKLVLVIDADLNQTVISWLQSLREDVQVIRNDYRRDLGQLTVFDQQQALDDSFIDALSDKRRKGRPVAYLANSKGKIQKVEALLQRDYPALRVLSVTSENTKNLAQKAFIASPDAEIAKYDAILLSPAVMTGIDIQTSFYAKFGNFTASWEAPAASGSAQMFERIRNADYKAIWIKEVQGNLEEDGDLLYNAQRSKAIDTYNAVIWKLSEDQKRFFALLHPLDDSGKPDFPAEQRTFYKLLADLRAGRNRQYNNLKASLLGIFAENYELSTSASASAQHAEALKEAAKEAKEAYRQLVLTVVPITKDQFEALEKAGTVTEEARAGFDRWQIESFYNQTVSEDLLDFDKDGKGRTVVRQFEDVTGAVSIEALKEADRAEMLDGVPLENRRHRYKKAAILHSIISHLWGDPKQVSEDLIATLQHAPALSESDFAERAVIALSLLEKVDHYYFDGRFDLDGSALLTVKRWLRKMGIYLTERRLQDGNQIIVDADKLRYLVRLSDYRQQVTEAEDAEEVDPLQKNVY